MLGPVKVAGVLAACNGEAKKMQKLRSAEGCMGPIWIRSGTICAIQGLEGHCSDLGHLVAAGDALPSSNDHLFTI